MITQRLSAFFGIWALALSLLLPASHCPASDILINNEPAWATPLEVPKQFDYPASDIQNGIYYLILDVQARVTPDQPTQTYQHYAEHIVNQNGVTENSQISINYDPSYQSIQLHTLRIHRAGQVIDKVTSATMKVLQREEEMESLIYNGQHTLNIILDDVRVGDTIEYSFSRIGSNPVYQNLFAFQHSLNWSVPVGALQLRVLWEKPNPLQHQVTRSNLKVEQTRTAAGIEYRIQDRNIALVPLQDNAPDWYSPWGRVSFSELDSWQAVVQWGNSLYHDAWQSNAELDAIADDIRNTSDSAIQRISKALRFVQDDIRYLGIELGENSHRPSPAWETLQRRYGDCKDKTVLFITLLRKLDISAYPALVNTDLGDKLAEQLPSTQAFDHVITYVEHNHQRWWLDPTRTYQYGAIDSIHQPDFGKALVLGTETATLQDMDPDNRRHGINIEDHFRLHPDTRKPVQFTSSSLYLGWNAERQRNRIAGDGQAKLQKQYVEFFQYYYPEIRSTQALEVEDDEQHNQLQVSEYYEIPSFWHDDAAAQRFTADFYPNGLSSYLEVPDEPSRQDPLYLTHPHRVDQTILVEFGADDWNFDADSFREDNRFFTFRYKAGFDPKARQLKLHYHYQSNTDFVAAADYREYREALQRVQDYLGYGIFQNYSATPAATESTDSSGLAWWQTLDQSTIIFGYLGAYVVVFLLWRLEQRRHPFQGEAYFYPVQPGKFIGMWVITFGLYPMYWFYRNFHYIRQQQQSSIMPLPRAFFYSFWYYNLWQYLKKDNAARHAESHLPNQAIAIVLALAFLGAVILMNESRWWMAGLLLSAFICMPLANYIQFINRENPDALHHASRWRVHNYLLALLSVPLLLLIQSSDLGFIPNAAVISGDRLWQSDIKRMQRVGVVKPGDEIQYFYSDGFLSVMEDGNGITQRHVFSYWREQDGTIQSETASFDDIDTIDVTRGSGTDNTVISVQRKDGSDFLLYLSTEESGDDRFIKALRAKLPASPTDS
ncbi:MAG: DUF3857 domain-containing protein [Ketobacter sp.]|nr:MAG: DUF3857 domain-containing protein [Ketobacter sp.]